jgi:hypothetical protein
VNPTVAKSELSLCKNGVNLVRPVYLKVHLYFVNLQITFISQLLSIQLVRFFIQLCQKILSEKIKMFYLKTNCSSSIFNFHCSSKTRGMRFNNSRGLSPTILRHRSRARRRGRALPLCCPVCARSCALALPSSRPGAPPCLPGVAIPPTGHAPTRRRATHYTFLGALWKKMKRISATAR